MFRVFKDHQLIASHPKAVNVRVNEAGETELFDGRGDLVATYKPDEFHAVGNVSICGGLDDGTCPVCERLRELGG